MKSFRQFIIEKEMSPGPKPGEAADTKSLIRNKQKKGQLPYQEPEVKTNNPPADVQGRKDATDPKKGGYSRVDDSLDTKKPSGRTKLGNDTIGGEVKITNPKDPNKPRIPDPKKGELGKLYKSGTKSDPKRAGSVRTTDKINSKLRAQRRARINLLTGKATPKGVENFAQNIGGYGRKGRKLTGAEWQRISSQAKNIASDPSSKEYKRIEAIINRSDYAGKRAQVPTKHELERINKEIRKSKTINAKVDIGKTSNAPTVFRRKPTSTVSLNTSTRRGRIANVPVNKAQAYTKKINDARLEKEANKVIEKLRRIRKNENSGLSNRMSNAYDTRQSKLKSKANEILKSINKDSKSSSTFKYKSPPTANPDLGKTKVRQSVKGPGSSTGSLSRANLRFSGDANYQKLKKTIDPVKTKTVNPRKTYNQMQKDISRVRGTKSTFPKSNLSHKIKNFATKIPKNAIDPLAGIQGYARQRDVKNATQARAITGGLLKARGSAYGFKKGFALGATTASKFTKHPAYIGAAGLVSGITGAVLTATGTEYAFDKALGKTGIKTQTQLQPLNNKTKTKVITANPKNNKGIILPPEGKKKNKITSFALNPAEVKKK